VNAPFRCPFTADRLPVPCLAPVGVCADLGVCEACGPADWPWPPAWLEALPEPVCSADWLAEHPLATHTGADTPTGAAADTAGLKSVEPTCTAPTDSEAFWPEGAVCPPVVVEAPEPAGPAAGPVEHRLATQTGAEVPTGAAADATGPTFVESTCTAPTECVPLWPAGRLCPPSVVEAPEPAGGPDRLVEQALATQTGADAATGAATDTAGLTLVELACTGPIDSDPDWPFPASAGAAVASATRQASNVSMSFIVLSFRQRTCD
jgi:hypothetical protein